MNGERAKFDILAIRIYCCDCGLAHLFTLENDKDGVPELVAYRDEYATEMFRKEKRRKKKKK